MNVRRGTAWFEARRVGGLIDNGDGVIRFVYDEAWVESGFPISDQRSPRGR